MRNLRRLSLYIQAVCALAWLLAFVSIEALLGLNRRPPVIIRPRKDDLPGESEAPLREPARACKDVRLDLT